MLSPNSIFKPSGLWLGAITVALIALPSLASATIINTTATAFSGDPLTASVTIDDESQAGDLVITLNLNAGPLNGDLRAFYADVADESLLSGLSVSGIDITSSSFAANFDHDLGPGTQIPHCESSGCDLAVEIGTFGRSPDNIQTVTFVLSHTSVDLTVDLLLDQLFVIRVSDVIGLERNPIGYSKLEGSFTVPEPSTGLLMFLGLAGLTTVGRRSSSTH